jgi:hypothetical protein
MNEMRLVEVTARRRNIGPIGHGSATRQVNGALKTLDAAKHLRCDTDLSGEYLDKVPLAQPELRGKVSSLRFARISSKDVQGGANCSMSFQCVRQTRDEGTFQNPEALCWIRSRAKLFAQIARGSSPNRFHICVSISELICGNAQETECAAGLEMHTHDVRSRINEQRSRVRP